MICSAGRKSFLRTRSCFAAAALLLLVGFSVWKAIAAQDALATQINQIFSTLANDKFPGVAVLVRKDGRTAFERGYGVRDLRSFAKIDPHTNFRLASCSKQFTAMSIMLLVHDGKLRYDYNLTDDIPDYTAFGKDSTLRLLLTHTSHITTSYDPMSHAEHSYQGPPSATHGYGRIYSYLSDHENGHEALAQHTLLSEKEMHHALTPAQLTISDQPKWPANANRPEGTPVSYGFGWFLDPYHNYARMWHYADTVGFHTYIQRFPAHRLTIIVLCNRTDLDPESLALRAADPYVRLTSGI